VQNAEIVTVRFDRRLVARIDPSVVVQEARLDAAQRLPDYLRERPLPFYPWLRRLAGQHLFKRTAAISRPASVASATTPCSSSTAACWPTSSPSGG
jgi:hypothetical protein